jgi:enoyl-CoA hydratase/carnithine racemase
MTVRLVIDDVGGVATITLDNPKLNIYDLAMRDELIECFDAVSRHPDVRAIVLGAAGPHYSAGADLREFGSAGSVMGARDIRWRRDPWTPLWEAPVPTIAALHGFVLGAGLEMSLLCDVRIATCDVVLGLPEVKLGMLPSAGGTQSLARVVGVPRSAWTVMTAANVDAERALEMELIDEIVDDADQRAHDLAAEMARADRHALVAARAALRAAADLPLESGLRRERLLARGLVAGR